MSLDLKKNFGDFCVMSRNEAKPIRAAEWPRGDAREQLRESKFVMDAKGMCVLCKRERRIYK